MKLNEAYKNLEKLNIQKDTQIQQLKVKEAAQNRKVSDLIGRFDSIYYDESIPAAEVAALKIEIDRAKKNLEKTQTELYNLENFGICQDKESFMKAYKAGMEPIIKEIGKLELKECIDNLTGFAARLEKANDSIIEYHRAALSLTGSGAHELKGSKFFFPATPADLDKLKGIIKELEELKPVLDTQIYKLKENGHALEDISCFSSDYEDLPDGPLYEYALYEDHNADFKKGDKVIYSKRTDRSYNSKGKMAKIPFLTMFGEQEPGPFSMSGRTKTQIHRIDKELE